MSAKKGKTKAKPKVRGHRKPGQQYPEPIQKMMNDGLIVRGSDPSLIIEWMPTALPMLDEATGGGIPLSRIIMLTGEWSSGKTLVAQYIARAFQDNGKSVLLMDAEQTYDPRWWHDTGVNTEDLWVYPVPSGEAAVNTLEEALGGWDCIIIDSIAALVPLAEQEAEVEKAHVALHARLINKMFRKVNGKLRPSGTTLVIINQLRTGGLGSYGGSQDTLPGGRGQQFWTTLWLRTYRIKWNMVGEERTGFVIGCDVTKNKAGRSGGHAELVFTFNGQLDRVSMLVQDALAREVIVRAGAWYRLPYNVPFADVTDVNRYLWDEDNHQMRVMGSEGLNTLVMNNPDAVALLEKMTYGEGEADVPTPAPNHA